VALVAAVAVAPAVAVVVALVAAVAVAPAAAAKYKLLFRCAPSLLAG
jgi:hypothetical protein